MRDPLDELDDFTTPGLSMEPLSASEVRRRGTRMRRRNNALVAVAGVAAVAVIATPIALAATGGPSTESELPIAPQPSSDVAWLKLIPTSFDLTEGLGGTDPQAAERIKVGDLSLGVPSIEVCGTQAWAAEEGTSDLLSAQYAVPNSGNSESRTVALYPDGAAAESAYADLRDAAVDCPTSVNDNGDTELVEVRDADLGSEESFVLVRQFQAPDDDFPFDGEVIQVAHTGNAVLVTTGPSASGDQVVDQEIDRRADQIASVTAAMDAFAAPSAAEQDEDVVSDGTTIPGGFPLLDGLPTDDEATDERFGREGPSVGLDPITLDACGTTLEGLPQPASTLRANWRDVPGAQMRALMTFGSEDEASAYVTDVLAFFSACGEYDDGGIVKVYHVTDEQVGDQAGSVVMGIEVEGEPGIGLQVVQVIRVGQAVLLVNVQEEATPVRADDPETSPASPASLTAEHLDRAAPVVAAMQATWG